jgi:hypothetical protein
MAPDRAHGAAQGFGDGEGDTARAHPEHLRERGGVPV